MKWDFSHLCFVVASLSPVVYFCHNKIPHFPASLPPAHLSGCCCRKPRDVTWGPSMGRAAWKSPCIPMEFILSDRVIKGWLQGLLQYDGDWSQGPVADAQTNCISFIKRKVTLILGVKGTQLQWIWHMHLKLKRKSKGFTFGCRSVTHTVNK